MGKHDRFRWQSHRTALCGLMAALSVVIFTLGSLIPFATFACPMLAMLCLPPAVCEYGTGTALVMYTAVSVLGLLLSPDKEIALLYVFLGWYPSIQAKVNSLPRFPCVAVKCVLFSVSMIVLYSLILYLFQLDAVVEEFSEYSTAMVAGMLLLGNVTFLLYDRVLDNFSRLYCKKRKR